MTHFPYDYSSDCRLNWNLEITLVIEIQSIMIINHFGYSFCFYLSRFGGLKQKYPINQVSAMIFEHQMQIIYQNAEKKTKQKERKCTSKTKLRGRPIQGRKMLKGQFLRTL